MRVVVVVVVVVRVVVVRVVVVWTHPLSHSNLCVAFTYVSRSLIFSFRTSIDSRLGNTKIR